MDKNTANVTHNVTGDMDYLFVCTPYPAFKQLERMIKEMMGDKENKLMQFKAESQLIILQMMEKAGKVSLSESAAKELSLALIRRFNEQVLAEKKEDKNGKQK